MFTQTQSRRLYSPEPCDDDEETSVITAHRDQEDFSSNSDGEYHDNSSVVEDDRVAFGNGASMPEHEGETEDDISDPDMIIYNKEDMTQYSRPMKVNRM